jgi:hypothetical protein
MRVVVFDHVEQCREPPVVVEAALLVRPQPGQRRRAGHMGWRAVGLERIDTDLGGGVQILPGLRVQRRYVAGRAFCDAVEDRDCAANPYLLQAAVLAAFPTDALYELK